MSKIWQNQKFPSWEKMKRKKENDKLLEILLPKIKKQYPKKKNGNAKDPRIGVTVSQKEIKENGEKVIWV